MTPKNTNAPSGEGAHEIAPGERADARSVSHGRSGSANGNLAPCGSPLLHADGVCGCPIPQRRDRRQAIRDEVFFWIEKGVRIFPVWNIGDDGHCACNPGGECKKDSPGKHPLDRLVPNGQNGATSDKGTWIGWLERFPDMNLGLPLEMNGLCALDGDFYKGDRARKEALEAEHGPLPRSWRQRSGSGDGEHWIFKHPGGRLRGSLGGITVRGPNYIVIAPSNHKKGGEYEWLDKPGEAGLAELPESWVAAIRKPDAEVGEVGTPSADDEPDWLKAIPQDERLRRMREDLEDETGEEKGVDDSGTTWNVVRGKIRGFAVRDPEAALKALLEIYNPRCKPPWPREEMVRKVRQAYTEAHSPEWGERLLNAFGEPVMRTDSAESPKPDDDKAQANARLGQRVSTLVDAVIDQSKIEPVPTPFSQLNYKLGGGLEPATSNLVNAPTGGGKTSFALQVAAYHAERTGPCIWYGAELTKPQITARLVAQRTGLSWRKALSGNVSAEQMHEVLDPLNLYLIGPQRDPLAAIKATLDEVTKEVSGVPMLVVDYIQLLAAVGTDQRLAMMSTVRAIHRLTEDRGLVTVVLSQVSRGNSDKIKQGSGNAADFVATGAETSELERSAATVMVLSFDPQDDVDTHEVTLMLSKARFGGGTKIGLRFHGPSGKWDEAERVPLSRGEVDREAEIMETIREHTAGTCQCLKRLTTNAITRGAAKDNPHRVGGNRTQNLATIRRLKRERKIRDDELKGLVLFHTPPKEPPLLDQLGEAVPDNRNRPPSLEPVPDPGTARNRPGENEDNTP